MNIKDKRSWRGEEILSRNERKLKSDHSVTQFLDRGTVVLVA